MKKIIIVDDLKTVLLTLESILTQAGYFVVSCVNSTDALDRFNAEHFDLMLSDIVMPGGANGYSLISTIRSGEKNKNIPIIMLTGKREKSDIEKAILSGANDYIVKPIDPEIVLTKVKIHLGDAENSQPGFVEAKIQSPAEIQLKTEVVSISEIQCQIITNYQLTIGQLYRLKADFLAEIELEALSTRITQIENYAPQYSATPQYKMTADFVGLTDKELSKIRLFVRRKLSMLQN
jgi:DNA-binding response OmpR family regulator